MLIAADTHAHLYPCHGTGAALGHLLRNLRRHAGDRSDTVFVGCLVERSDCHAFRSLRDARLAADGFEPWKARGPAAIEALHQGGGASLILLAGRQIITSERLEVLALVTEDEFPDGLPAEEAIRRVAAGGGIPVLPWSPGKWFGARGRVVRSLFERFGPAGILAGDTTLRPLGWGEPGLMRRAREDGHRVVAGSDPLPFRGEERRWGQYATLMESRAWDASRPADSFAALLRGAGASAIRFAGSRSSPATWAWRLARNELVRRR